MVPELQAPRSECDPLSCPVTPRSVACPLTSRPRMRIVSRDTEDRALGLDPNGAAIGPHDRFSCTESEEKQVQ